MQNKKILKSFNVNAGQGKVNCYCKEVAANKIA